MGRFSIHTSLCNVYKFNFTLMRANMIQESVRISFVPMSCLRGFPAVESNQMQNKNNEMTTWTHTHKRQFFCLLLTKQHNKHAGKPVCAPAATAMTVAKTWRPNRYLHSNAKQILSVSLKVKAELLCSQVQLL